MMKYIFDTSWHLHVGYHENGFDIESTLYKIIDRDAWVMFVDWGFIEGRFPKDLEKQFDPHVGLDILCVLDEDVEYTTAATLFEEWLISVNII